MCGIIGFTGILDAKTVLTEGLKELEYRGYDSAGISFFTDNGIRTVKATGKVSNLCDKVKEESKETAACGIGHTRWATHGGVSDVNCHPHKAGKVTLIHNGIIENYKELQEELAKDGQFPVSQTDSEIAAMVINSCYNGNPVQAIKDAVKKLDGAYAFCIMFEDHPDVIYAIRNGSPLVAASCEEGSVIASDMVALIKYSKDYFVLPERHIARLTKNEIVVTDMEHRVIMPKMLHVNWDVAAARKGGYDYFMLKEIHEQPDSLRNTIAPRVVDGLPDFTADQIPDSMFDGIHKIVITACGTAMHAGLIGKNMIEKLTRVPVSVEIASEFRYASPIIDEHTLVITISQSGETADTLAALRLARENGSKTLSIVNVKGSSIARESDYVLYTHAGPEIAVASTKAYTVQLSALYLFAFRFALVTGKLTEEAARDYIGKLEHAISIVEEVLSYDKQIETICQRLKTAEDLFFIGRGLDYGLSCEGSIKLKEISYIHSEAYAAGELKHGTISLITDNIPVIALATQENVLPKMISNIREVRSRGAMVILVTNAEVTVDASLCDHLIKLPAIADEFAPFAAAVVLQYIAYYTAISRGLNVDQPRNLAKSVTVE
ncbi:glutamine--fructose-6-phosphate transaminase (isomerizing) [[Clostridium] polysaccharolyticum]|uniref:Glutamine--fructose-6-phosphate aminotransferase [isomerizing] n=1 Tax=[Clostridium] polysaccharolyticum TaxID=29364 RepID=A0A1H9Y9W5_9FIRM|nr:glutamine--fructose-6-phosphate transaminase (isomerizing) [[Clostridium] polysaccharolyticum]SES65750.1 glutamine--fructose-6-phosphate transaminase [[Clostridium] polysaccharolyticum]